MVEAEISRKIRVIKKHIELRKAAKQKRYDEIEELDEQIHKLETELKGLM